ncbi:uncharacterized protein [Amphiura filiformis]|uniref:uncharacterized protein n=1 Tax=Amphiura filiformis TaxID=82378 RepID=UPI003B210A2F
MSSNGADIQEKKKGSVYRPCPDCSARNHNSRKKCKECGKLLLVPIPFDSEAFRVKTEMCKIKNMIEKKAKQLMSSYGVHVHIMYYSENVERDHAQTTCTPGLAEEFQKEMPLVKQVWTQYMTNHLKPEKVARQKKKTQVEEVEAEEASSQDVDTTPSMSSGDVPGDVTMVDIELPPQQQQKQQQQQSACQPSLQRQLGRSSATKVVNKKKQKKTQVEEVEGTDLKRQRNANEKSEPSAVDLLEAMIGYTTPEEKVLSENARKRKAVIKLKKVSISERL